MPDIRYALRSLWLSKGFAVVAILCLGFGIGLNTTIFSIVDGVLLKPFPYADPERIVIFNSVNQPLDVREGNISALDLRDLKASVAAFTGIAGLQGRSLTITDDGGDPERYSGAAISWDLFPLLGVSPIVGPGFTAKDDEPSADPVVILGYTVWTRRYGADPNVIGRRLLVNGAPAVVVGVMPEGFAFPGTQNVWVPVGPIVAKMPRQSRTLFTFGRLGPGVTIERANAELGTAAARLAAEYANTNKDWTVRAIPLREDFIPPDVTLVVWLMMAGVTLVLFIACSNVANLLLARASVRRREISVRAALGAGRGRILRQLLTESVVLALVSVPLGVLLAEFGTRWIANAMPVDEVPHYIRFAVDWRSLLYTLVIAIGTALAFGLLPALQVSRGNLHESLKEGTRGNSARRSLLRSTLVVVQVSLALVALVGAMLFVRTFANLNGYAVGFDPAPLMTMRIYLPGAVYEAPDAKARRVQDILDRIEGLPGVEAAFASNMVPIGSGGDDGNILIDGQPGEPGREPWISFVGVTPHFYRTLGVTLSGGRDFTAAEGTTRTPVAIVNQTMARQFWPERSPVGARFRLVNHEIPDWFTIVGVAPDIKQDEIDSDDEPFPVAYVPYPYQQTLNTGLTIRVASGDPAGITGAVREQIRASDSTIPVFAVQTLEALRRLGYWQYALFGWIFGTIGIVGLLLASVGVYGVLSYAVSQRTQEIGVRMALGASPRDVLRLIVGHGVILAGIGVGAGLVLAPLGTWFGRSLFFNVSPFDPLSFGGVAVFLVAVAGLASYLPARRATRIDPVKALRGE